MMLYILSYLLYVLPAQVLKSMDEAMLTAKAYCGRVITEWLAYALKVAIAGPLGRDEEIRWLCVTVMLDAYKTLPCGILLVDFFFPAG